MLAKLLLCKVILAVVTTAANISCKCAPEDGCWPTAEAWAALNASVAGQLIANSPIAGSCYPGVLQDLGKCAYVDQHWADQDFQATNAIGLSYPDDSCPPVNASAGQSPGHCSIGTSPRYTVNATTQQHVVEAVNFSRKNNIRLVVKTTGHDLLLRSTGYGSLSIWLAYLRDGIEFRESYDPGDCIQSTWRGSAFTIRGGYTWEDVYPEASTRNLIVVGGGTPSVSCLGGWMSGGGHGPATGKFGLGADQVLSAVVVLASGQIVTASPCSHPTLFFSIRGGGPSTYGVVVQTIIKAYPTQPVTAIRLSIAPLNATGVPLFMEALATVYSAYPDLSDNGFSGYGSWSISSPMPVIENYTGSYTATGFNQIYAVFNTSPVVAQSLFTPLASKLQAFKGSLYVDTEVSYFSTYWAYYETFSNISSPVGQQAAIGSRLLDRDALTGKRSALVDTLKLLAGSPEQFTSNNIVFVGAVPADAYNPWSGVNPAWREAYVHHIVARGWLPGSGESLKDAIRQDITNVKVKAMKNLAPGTGAYMNEGDFNDPDFMKDFYGPTHVNVLGGFKTFYDSESVFYCPTCIGSSMWEERPNGQLCLASDGSLK